MTDPYHPVIDLTDLCNHADNATANAVIDLVTAEWICEPTWPPPRRAGRRGRYENTRSSNRSSRVVSTEPTLVNREPIEITDSPQASNDRSTGHRKVGRPSRKKNEEPRSNKDIDEPVRDRSPLGGNFGVCPICLDTLGVQPLVSTKCGHVYCQKCLTQALRTEKKCPTCRKSLRGSTAFHQLFLNRG